MITIGFITLYLVSVAIAFYWGRNFDDLNSVSDLEAFYQKQAKKFEDAKAKVSAEIDTLEAKITNLKNLI
jgi:hypothetical protein